MAEQPTEEKGKIIENSVENEEIDIEEVGNISSNSTETKELICGNCSYKWRTLSSHRYVTCPSCLRKTKNVTV